MYAVPRIMFTMKMHVIYSDDDDSRDGFIGNIGLLVLCKESAERSGGYGIFVEQGQEWGGA